MTAPPTIRLPARDRPRVLFIYEPVVDGHHLLYVRAIVDGAVGAYDRLVWLTTAAAKASEEADVHLGDVIADGRLQTLTLPDPARAGLVGDFTRWKHVRRMTSATGSSLAVPHGDRVFVWWLLLGRRRVPTHWLLMRPPNPRVAGRVRKLKHRMKSALLEATTTMRAVQFHPLISREGSGITSPRWSTPVEDPISTTAVDRGAARERFGIAVDRVTCGIVGVLTERKGVRELVSVWDQLPSPRPLLLLAGKPDATVEADLRGRQAQELIDAGDLRLVAGYLPNADLDAAVAALDLSLQLYDNSEGPSGIYAKAKDLGVPVLTYAGSTYLSSEIAALGNGSICSDLSEAGLRRSVDDCLTRLDELAARARAARPVQAAPTRFAEQLGLVRPAA
jgi:glycosyltransferase involved in cell wall biosynthesis